MILRKLPDWRDRLHSYIESIADDPFDWKAHNCAGFVSKCLSVQCGADPWADMRAEYANLESDGKVRLKLSRDYGGLDLMIDAQLMPHGFRKTECASAGSPVITIGDNGKIGAGVSMGRYTAALTIDGMVMSARFRQAAAWVWP